MAGTISNIKPPNSQADRSEFRSIDQRLWNRILNDSEGEAGLFCEIHEVAFIGITVSTCLQQYARTRGREDGAIPGSARVAASLDGRESEVLEGEDKSGPDEAKGSSARSSSAPNSADLLDPLRQIGHGRLSFCSSSRRKLDAT